MLIVKIALAAFIVFQVVKAFWFAMIRSRSARRVVLNSASMMALGSALLLGEFLPDIWPATLGVASLICVAAWIMLAELRWDIQDAHLSADGHGGQEDDAVC